jgi:hypothetical protein
MGFDLRFEQDGAFPGTSKAWLASRMGTDLCRGVTLALELFNPTTHYPDGYLRSGLCLAKVTTGTLLNLYGPYNGLANEVQTFDLGAASAGTFTLSFQGSTTGNIPFNATAAQVQAAMEAMPNINPGDVTVTGGPLPASVTLTFSGQYAGINVSPITIDGTLTTGETITIASPTAGGSAGLATLDVLTGHLFDDVKVRNGAGRAVGALYWNGMVVESRLPANSGIDPAGKVDVAAHIRYE